jgi:uncharacterized protein DUF397
VDRLRWRRSSYSVGNPEQCVEAALTTKTVFLRDSKNPDGPVLMFSHEDFRVFMHAARESPN